MQSLRVHIDGVVQGVGFRPYVWNLADRHRLRGWVRNSASGVDIEVEGPSASVQEFLDQVATGPPLARIDAVTITEIAPGGHERFTILDSREDPDAFLPVSPDIAVCDDCLREMNDSRDRRYRYPFINCTNCGPRYTIIRGIPYDRHRTTMDRFPMCDDCAAEYEDPGDRRFHAQPVACPACGPRIWLEEREKRIASTGKALRLVRERLAAGAVIAVKGLGGFHLACDAASPQAVARLRERKHREEKPFALMAPDLATMDRHVKITASARELLESPARPIVLMPRRGSNLAREVAPGRDELGFLLPYTPLHHLLIERARGFPEVLVMTSGNLSDEPIAYENDDARHRLGSVADGLLLHDRDIYIRCDDSVAAEVLGKTVFFRRSRGYAPLPLSLPAAVPRILAVGGELKNVFCVTRDEKAFLSHHVGDLDYMETLSAFETGVAHLSGLFRVKPECIAHDLHPDYQSTRCAGAWAAKEGIPTVGVQHHHAHIAAGMGDNGLTGEDRVIGVALDGTGYGSDGTIWGGEFLIAGYREFERVLHLKTCPLPGGDAATRKPYRVALSWLHRAGIPWKEAIPPVDSSSPRERAVLERLLEAGINAPFTSSVGRLFDAVASLAGICHRATYEAQAACELEAACDPAETGAYAFAVDGHELDPVPALRELVGDVEAGRPAGVIAARFHRGLAAAVAAACRRIRDHSALDRVVLSGGVWQNRVLLRRTVSLLEESDFRVLLHHRVPANDGGLALGQALVAAARLRETSWNEPDAVAATAGSERRP